MKRAAQRLSLRLVTEEIPAELGFPRSADPVALGLFLQRLVREEPAEVAGAVFFDYHGRPLGYAAPFRGVLSQVLVEGRQLFHLALEAGANSIVLFHNHPSGSLRPSSRDVELTRLMVRAGVIVGVAVRDHLIVTRSAVVSFAELGLVPELGWRAAAILPWAASPGGARSRKDGRSRVKPKYRDPETGETWAGRGAMAMWLRRRLAEGRSLEEFKV